MGLSGAGSGPEQPLTDCLVRRRTHHDIHVTRMDYLRTPGPTVVGILTAVTGVNEVVIAFAAIDAKQY